MNVPMADLRPQVEARAGDSRVFLAQLFSKMNFILGEQVARFERDFAGRLGSAFAVGVGSGTDALELSLRASGLARSRPQVITTALTSPFTAQAILAAGGVPRFADVDAVSLLLDADAAGEQVSPETGALLPVHLYGQPCDLGRLSALARRSELALIQDACQAHGARCAGRPLTEYSDWVAYSFYPTKNLGCLGDGGAVVTDSDSAAARIRLLRDGAREGGQISRCLARNSRLDEIQACYLQAFLPHLEDWNARRARLAALYDEALAGCECVTPIRRGAESVNHLYVVRAQDRDGLRAYLEARGVTTGVHYPLPLHLHTAFREFGSGEGSLPRAERACREILSLPLYPYLSDSAVEYVAGQLLDFYARRSG